VSFDVAATSYDRFMGRYSALLSPQLADLAGVATGQRALDVGCGPGALTAELVRRLGPGAVSAIDPSEPFVAAIQERYPEVRVQLGSAEQLPFPGHSFDVTLGQLVVHFMTNPLTGLGEMRRVTRPGGVVAACVWDLAGGQGPVSPFWEAARRLDSAVEDESRRAGARQGHLAELFQAAGLRAIEEAILSVSVEHTTFEDWWEPYALGVGPAGRYIARLGPNQVEKLRDLASEMLPAAPFVLTARAWAARGIA
jgi:SAM-dependent methyltransferase